MRPNIVTEASFSTRVNQWWSSIPFITSGVLILCGVIYLICLLSGYDSYYEICFLPSRVVANFQVYRFYTSVLFHGSLLHLAFNMIAMVPLGTELERIMGSVRLFYLICLLGTSNAIFHTIIALLVVHNPLYSWPMLMNECSIGFSGIIFSMIVIETNLSGVQSRSVFGLFNVPAQWYAWILLILFQLLASNISLLGHLCGILSGFAYTYGLLAYLLPGPSFYSAIEGFPILSACIRRPGFILCTGGTTYGQLATISNSAVISNGFSSGNLWRNISSWMPQRESSIGQPAAPSQDPRFPGRGRSLGSARNQGANAAESESSLGARLLDDTVDRSLQTPPPRREPRSPDARNVIADTEEGPGIPLNNQGGLDSFEEELKKLVGMGFEKTHAEVALAAADGDPTVAIEILMSQQR